jgi:hypothetical protein
MALPTSEGVAERASKVAVREYPVIAVLQSGSTQRLSDFVPPRRIMAIRGISNDQEFKTACRLQRKRKALGSAVMTMMCPYE